MLKPLTRDELRRILRTRFPDKQVAEVIFGLLSAEGYWREKVRGSLMGTVRDGMMICNWCETQGPQFEKLKHAADCAWDAAQEENDAER